MYYTMVYTVAYEPGYSCKNMILDYLHVLSYENAIVNSPSNKSFHDEL